MRSSRYLILASLCLFLLGCQREAAKKSSLVLRMPKAEKLSGLSTPWPSDRKACFGVNVTSSDIAANYPSCSPVTGIVKGYVESDQVIEVDVPMGKSRKIDLYLYLQPTGQNNPCPNIGPSFGGTNLTNTYLIGTATADIVNQIETVNITASFPGLSQNIAVNYSLPSTCTASSIPPGNPGFHISADAGTALGSGYKLKGKIGTQVSGNTLTGTGFKLKVNGVQ